MTEFNHQDNSNHPLGMIIWIKLMGLVPWLSLCWLNEAIQIYSCEKWVSCNKRSQQFRFLCFRSACQEHHALEWGLSKNCASRDCQNIGGELWKVSVFLLAPSPPAEGWPRRPYRFWSTSLIVVVTTTSISSVSTTASIVPSPIATSPAVVIGRGPLVVVLEVVIVVWSLLLLEIVVVSISCSSRVGSVAVVTSVATSIKAAEGVVGTVGVGLTHTPTVGDFPRTKLYWGEVGDSWTRPSTRWGLEVVSWRIVVVCRRSLVVLEIVVVVRSLLLLLEIVVGWSLLLLLRLVVIVSRVGRGGVVVAVVSPTTTVVAPPSSPAPTTWTTIVLLSGGLHPAAGCMISSTPTVSAPAIVVVPTSTRLYWVASATWGSECVLLILPPVFSSGICRAGKYCKAHQGPCKYLVLHCNVFKAYFGKDEKIF